MLGFGYTRLNDEELAGLTARGNEKAFAEILKRHQDAVYGFGLRMLHHPQEAEDAAQETFLRFFKAAGRYRAQASLRTYLLKIMKNLCIDFYRKRKTEPMTGLPEPCEPDTPLDLLEGAVAEKALEAAVAKLPVNQRTALLLRHTEKMTHKEICEVMDLSQGAVESLLVRARKTLRLALSEFF
jgi:RNA polymerase sigma-70 factor (ECF subfamily)